MTNVTIALPNELIRQARHLAVDRGVSLSRYLALILEEHIAADQHYRAARERQQELMRAGLPLGTYGKPGWSRDELHER